MSITRSFISQLLSDTILRVANGAKVIRIRAHIYNFTFYAGRSVHAFATFYFPLSLFSMGNLLNLDVKYVIDTIQALNQVSVKITRRSESSVKSEILSIPEVKSIESFTSRY